MRIHNKYLRNRHFRTKYWKHVRNKSHPFETFCPYNRYGNEGYYHNSHYYSNDTESQVQRNFDWITEKARALENGGYHFHAPKSFRQSLNWGRKAKERATLSRIRNGDYDIEFPKFKRDADWYYF